MSLSLHQRLGALGIDHTWDDYGPGTHTGPTGSATCSRRFRR